MAESLGEFEQLVLLAILRLKETAYGVTIRRALEDRTGRDIAAGAVYTTLGRLQNRGLVSARLAESAPERSGRRRKYYTVLPAGASALHRSYSDLQTMMDGVLPQLADLAARSDDGSGQS